MSFPRASHNRLPGASSRDSFSSASSSGPVYNSGSQQGRRRQGVETPSQSSTRRHVTQTQQRARPPSALRTGGGQPSQTSRASSVSSAQGSQQPENDSIDEYSYLGSIEERSHPEEQGERSGRHNYHHRQQQEVALVPSNSGPADYQSLRTPATESSLPAYDKFLENYRRLKFICRSQAEYIGDLEEKQREFIEIAQQELSPETINISEQERSTQSKSVEHWRNNFEEATKRAETAEQQYEDAVKQINSLKDALYEAETNSGAAPESRKDEERDSEVEALRKQLGDANRQIELLRKQKKRPSAIVSQGNGFSVAQVDYSNTDDIEYLRRKLEEASNGIQERDAAISELRADIMEEVMRLKENKEAQYKFSVLEKIPTSEGGEDVQRIQKTGSYLSALREQLLQLRELMAAKERVANEEKQALENQLIHVTKSSTQRTDKMKAEIRELQEQVEALSRDSVEGSASDFKRLRAKCRRLEERLEEALSSHKEVETLRLQDVEKLEEDLRKRDESARYRESIMDTLKSTATEIYQGREQSLQQLQEAFSQYSDNSINNFEQLNRSYSEQWNKFSGTVNALSGLLQDIQSNGDQIVDKINSSAGKLKEELNSSFDNHGQRLEKLHRLLDEANTRFSQLDVSRLEAQTKQKEEFNRLQTLSDESNNEINDMRARLSEVEKRNYDLLLDRDNTVKHLRESNEKLTEDLQNSQYQEQENMKLRTQNLDNSSRRINEVEARYNELQSELLSRVETAEKHATELQSALNKEQQRREEAVEAAENRWKAKYESLKQRNEQIHQELQSVKKEKEEAERRNSARIQQLEGDLEKSRENAETERENHRLEREQWEHNEQALQVQLDELREDNRLLRERVEQLNGFLSKDTREMSKFAEEQKALHEEAEAISEMLSKRSGELNTSFRKLQEETERFKQQYSDELKSWMDYTARLERRTEEAESFNNKERESLRRIMDDVQQRSESLQKIVDSGERVIESYKEASGDLLKTQKQSIEEFHQAKTEALEIVESKCTNMASTAESIHASYSSTVKDSKEEIDKRIAEWSECKHYFDEQNKLIKQLTGEEVNSLRTRLGEAQQESERANRELETATKAAEDKENLAMQELEELRETLRSVREETLQREQSLADKERKLIEELSQRSEEQNQKQSEIEAKIAKERRKWEKKFEEREKIYKTELADSRAEMHRLFEASRERQSTYEQEHESMKRELENLRKADEKRQALVDEERAITEELLRKLQDHANSLAVSASHGRISQQKEMDELRQRLKDRQQQQQSGRYPSMSDNDEEDEY
eukprot:gb/GECG01015414.1/.p1 GENE.gb/GECG01015414.1/~~gb/GECG01015414.1/.p1  ORF type:complete len:1296 (+),score=329.47 gb/GECG01015414.1/:1-3888(+)